MDGARLLFHRHTPWQSAIRCSTNILANRFREAGASVAYMQGIVHGGNVLWRRGQWQSWKEGPRRVDGTLVFTPFALSPYSRVWPLSSAAAARRSYRSCVPSIESTLDRYGFGQPDVIWTANPGSGVLKHMFPAARLLFQVVDYYPAFAGPAIADIERYDYRAADHVFVIGEALREHVLSYGIPESRLTVLGQGVDHARFSRPAERPPEYRCMEGPIAVWVGVLSKGDPGLFEAVAQKLGQRGGYLVLIGPGAEWADALAARHPHVVAPGPRKPAQVPAYLRHADVGLMLYDRRRPEVYVGQNPLKLYEYAAAGLAIVSTPHEEYRYLDTPAAVVDSEQSAAQALDDALSQLDRRRRQSLEFARAYSWDRVFDRARRVVATGLSAATKRRPLAGQHADFVSQ